MADAVVFIDSGVMIDLLAKREHYAGAAALFELIDGGHVDGCTTPVVLANIDYIVTKYSNRTKARRALQALLKRISVLTIDHSTVRMAVDSAFTDFEDAMQYYAAEKAAVDFIITSNTKDYSKGSITVLTAEQFVDLHGSTQELEE
ncbi:MAG: PIN domain-containing protein [Spirochaetaceae bacterium]|nr:MAG: PIN domain-containing protein [Spirochaetaceae bacterium]